jgi:hypothetical protein
MAEENHTTKFTIENLNALASRLADHADAVLARKRARFATCRRGV